MPLQKIIHIDMDYFFAAIEERDNPSLKHHPIAVGGDASHRGVICTSNYLARQFGVRSAMSTAKALQLCPALIVVRPNSEKYRQASEEIRHIFHRYTDIVEPLSLDEAYLDVTESTLFQGYASKLAKQIKRDIQKATGLTASAGVAPNKLLAKIASDWNKPNGLFVITPQAIEHFMETLPVKKLFGVGPVTASKLYELGIQTCQELQNYPRSSLQLHFGKMAYQLYQFARGIDARKVQPSRTRKSISVEETFSQDILHLETLKAELSKLLERLKKRLPNPLPPLKSMFVKIKFSNFVGTTIECATTDLDFETLVGLLEKGLSRQEQAVRLLGLGLRFQETAENPLYEQLLLSPFE